MLSTDQVASQGPGGFLNLNGGPTDPYYALSDGSGYASVADACAAVPPAARRNRTVNVASVEYCWLETDISDNGLLPKLVPGTPGSGGGVGIPLDFSYDVTADGAQSITLPSGATGINHPIQLQQGQGRPAGQRGIIRNILRAHCQFSNGRLLIQAAAGVKATDFINGGYYTGSTGGGSGGGGDYDQQIADLNADVQDLQDAVAIRPPLDPDTNRLSQDVMALYDPQDVLDAFTKTLQMVLGYDAAQMQQLLNAQGTFRFAALGTTPAPGFGAQPTLTDGGFTYDATTGNYTSGPNGGTMVFGSVPIPEGEVGRIRMQARDYQNNNGNRAGSKGTPRLLLLTEAQAQGLVPIVHGEQTRSASQFELWSDSTGQVHLGEQAVTPTAVWNYVDPADVATVGTYLEIRYNASGIVAFYVVQPGNVEVAPRFSQWQNQPRPAGNLYIGVQTEYQGVTLYGLEKLTR